MTLTPTTALWAGLLAALPLASSVQAQGLSPLALRLGGELPAVKACPEGLPAGTECRLGRDYLGAWIWMARPADWNGRLVVHSHGGPELGEPRAERTAEDLQRWSVWLRAGYAWVGSTYRQGGVELRAAAEDTERARQAFIGEYGEPQVTLLHGQSWGAGVAAVVAERYTTPDLHPKRGSSGRAPYTAVLLTSGVLAGGSRAYDVRLDLRVLYQALCGNHPRADEADYPLWMGLPPAGTPGAALKHAQLAERVDECTGVRRPAAQRTPAQKRALAALTGITTLPESTLIAHLNWATWHFQDIVWRKLKGRNPFGNEGVVYRGSGDAKLDAELNAKVARYQADPAALAALAADTDPGGAIHRPVLTVHATRDPTAFVEQQSQWRATMAEAGTEGNLVQVYTDDAKHSYLSDATYVAAADALLAWAAGGDKPTPQAVAQRCLALGAPWNPARDCRFLPDYQPQPLEARVPARVRTATAPVRAPLRPPAEEAGDGPRLPPAPTPISPLTMPPAGTAPAR